MLDIIFGVTASAGHRKITFNSATANSAKLQEVFRNRKFAIGLR